MILKTGWKQLANCRNSNPSIFFFDESDVRTQNVALKLCGDCEVKTECLQYALENKEHFGIWGGLMPLERRNFKRINNSNSENRCGTWSGYNHHRRLKEKMCPECREVANAARRSVVVR